MTQHQKIFETPLYPYARTADQDAAEPARHKVIVVGAGPIGMAAALEAALADLRARPGEGLVLAGPWQPPEVQALAHWANLRLNHGHVHGPDCAH